MLMVYNTLPLGWVNHQQSSNRFLKLKENPSF